jgi:hypothetical protein
MQQRSMAKRRGASCRHTAKRYSYALGGAGQLAYQPRTEAAVPCSSSTQTMTSNGMR